jgi:hypothetical protein
METQNSPENRMLNEEMQIDDEDETGADYSF